MPVTKQDLPEKFWDKVFAPSSALAMITTVDASGRPNIASYGTCTRVNHRPVYVAFTTTQGKDTASNLAEVGEFTVNLPRWERSILEKVRVCGLPFARGVNEFEKAGLTAMPAKLVRPPRIVECPRHFECKVEWTKEWAEGRLMVCGRVVAVSVDEGCIDDDGFVLWDKVMSAHYCGGPYGGQFVAAYEVMGADIPYEGPEVEIAERSHQKTYHEFHD
jgi:flavin reductase (DIM6/NTAB) family NADH-FMN oxidoreductase RutF